MDMTEIEEWAWSVSVRKMVVAVVGFLVSKGVIVILVKYGVVVDTAKLELAATTAGVGAFRGIHDYVKLKTGWTWL